MVSVPQLEQESCSDEQENFGLTEGEYVFHMARFAQHLQQASAILDRQMQRGAPPHIKRVFRQIQAGLLLAAESVRHATQRSARNG
jgi:hypothetical protein